MRMYGLYKVNIFILPNPYMIEHDIFCIFSCKNQIVYLEILEQCKC